MLDFSNFYTYFSHNVNIYDGDFASTTYDYGDITPGYGRLLASYSGSYYSYDFDQPRTVFSDSASVAISFHSNSGASSYRGFKALYTTDAGIDAFEIILSLSKFIRH